MQLIPGGSLIFSFDVESATGTPVSFDASPAVVLTFQHNGVADTGWTSYTMTDATAGNYDVSTTIPSGYVLGDYIACMADGYVGGVEKRIRVFAAQLKNTPDNATLVAGQTFSTTGAVGSVTGNVGGSTASVVGAVGSVTGNVGGNVVGSVGSVTAPVTLPTSVPAAYATSANQTTILGQTTAASIAGAVWNALLGSYVATASFGKWVNGLISSLISTSGQTTPTPIATNTSGYVAFSNAIPTPPTAAQIATAIFTDVLSGSDFATAGTYGYLWHAATLTGNNINSYSVNASSGGGSGNGSVTVTVTSTASGTPVVPGAIVSLNNSAGAQVASGTTNSSGVVVLSADAGTYALLTTLSGQYSPVSQAFTMEVGTGNTAAVSLTPIVAPVAPANYCAMAGTTFFQGVATPGMKWTVVITALPTGFPSGNQEFASYSGYSGLGGAVGDGSPAAVVLPQGATYSWQVGNGPVLTGQTVPTATSGTFPANFG